MWMVLYRTPDSFSLVTSSLNRVKSAEEVGQCVYSLVCDLRLPRFQMPKIARRWLFVLMHTG